MICHLWQILKFTHIFNENFARKFSCYIWHLFLHFIEYVIPNYEMLSDEQGSLMGTGELLIL